MKTVEFELSGKVYHLYMNGAALFDCFEHFETGADFIEKLADDTKESLDATCWCLAKFSEQGARAILWESGEKVPTISPQRAAAMMRPLDVLRARMAIRAAYRAGFGREEASDDEEIDTGLLELQKKTEAGSVERSICSWLRSFFAWAFRKE